MGDGDLDIDPDGPNLEQQQRESLAKLCAIEDAAQSEQLALLSNDHKILEQLYLQMRKLYCIRIVAAVAIIIGMVLLVIPFGLHFGDNLTEIRNFEACVTANSWSSWKKTDDLMERDRCGAKQSVRLSNCPKCEMSNLPFGTAISANASEDGYLICEHEPRVFLQKSVWMPTDNA